MLDMNKLKAIYLISLMKTSLCSYDYILICCINLIAIRGKMDFGSDKKKKRRIRNQKINASP